jgi:hypothetical protein
VEIHKEIMIDYKKVRLLSFLPMLCLGISSPTSSISKKIHRKEYQMEENGIGTNSYQKGLMDQRLPCLDNRKAKIAISGSLISTCEDVLRIYYDQSAARMTHVFSFENGGLTWKSKLDHALFGMRNLQSQKGKRA